MKILLIGLILHRAQWRDDKCGDLHTEVDSTMCWRTRAFARMRGGSHSHWVRREHQRFKLKKQMDLSSWGEYMYIHFLFEDTFFREAVARGLVRTSVAPTIINNSET